MENVNSVEQNQETNPPVERSTEADTVKYDTYKRVLPDHKKSKAKVEELEARLFEIERKEKELEEKRLQEQGEYKKLLELERSKRAEEESKRIKYEKDLLDAHKLNALKEKLPGRVKRNEYYSFVDLDNIIIDPETGHIEESSLQSVAERFINEHGSLLERQGVNMPQDAAKDGKTLNYEQWKNLPLKEKKERMSEVFQNHRR